MYATSLSQNLLMIILQAADCKNHSFGDNSRSKQTDWQFHFCVFVILSISALIKIKIPIFFLNDMLIPRGDFTGPLVSPPGPLSPTERGGAIKIDGDDDPQPSW